MGKAALIIAATALAPIGLLCAGDAVAARSTSGKVASEECEERRSAPVTVATPVFDIRLPKPAILKRKRRYIRM